MRKLNLLIVISVCVALFVGCTGNMGETPTNEPQQEALTVQTTETGDSSVEQPKTVYGEISEVIGNALVIKEVEMPEMRVFNAEDMPTELTLPDGTLIPMGEDGRPDFSDVDMSQFQMPEGMTMPEGGDGQGFRTFSTEGVEGGQGGDMTRQPRTQEKNYTGEEIEVIIPVGVPIMTRTRGEDGIEEKELTLTNVKSGNMITVTYKEDGTTIDTVFVSQDAFGGMGFAGGGDMGFYIGGPAGASGGETITFAMPANPMP